MEENKKNEMRELSLDEMDKVSGGVDGLTDRYGNYRTAKEVSDFAFSMLDQFGWDVASEMFCNVYMVSLNEARKISGRSDNGKMAQLINQTLKIYDRIEKTGHSY